MSMLLCRYFASVNRVNQALRKNNIRFSDNFVRSNRIKLHTKKISGNQTNSWKVQADIAV